jgi:hypothetical protein
VLANGGFYARRSSSRHNSHEGVADDDPTPRAREWVLFGKLEHVIKALDGLALDRKIRAAGWSFFFMAAEVKVMFFGAVRAKSIQKALKRILGKVSYLNFNSLEVTGIVPKRFLGVPYAIVSAHSRHVQQNCHLDSAEERRAAQRDRVG